MQLQVGSFGGSWSLFCAVEQPAAACWPQVRHLFRDRARYWGPCNRSNDFDLQPPMVLHDISQTLEPKPENLEGRTVPTWVGAPKTGDGSQRSNVLGP